MSRKSEEVEVNTEHGPVTFTITQIGGLKAARMFIANAPKLAPIIAVLVGLESKTGEKINPVDVLKKLDVAKLGEAIAKVTPDEFEAIALTLLRGTVGKATDEFDPMKKILIKLDDSNTIDQTFAGNVFELFKLVGAAAKLNYSFS